MSRPVVGIAVIGLGSIGRFHARTVAELAGARLAMVADADPGVAQRVADELRVAWSESFDGALAASGVEAVVIATPSPLHAPMVEAAAAAGKHVLCEKPLALDRATAERAVAAASMAGVIVQLGFQRRFDPEWRALERLLRDGELGEPRLLRIAHRNASARHGADVEARLGDLLDDMASHDLDSARWLLGDMESVRVVAARGGLALGLALRARDGAVALVDVVRNAGYGFDCRAELMGTEATACVGARFAGIEVLADGWASRPLPADNLERHGEAYRAEVAHFVEAVRQGGPVRVDAADGLATVRLVEAARRALASSEVTGA